MNWFFNPCRRHRQNLALLAGGMLREKDQTMEHLAKCPDCQKYFESLKVVATGLCGWEGEFSQLQPSAAMQLRWQKAVQAAERPRQEKAGSKGVIREWYRETLWPYRRIWASLAAVWLLIFVGQYGLQDHPRAVIAKSSPLQQQQIIMAFKERQMILAELLADHSGPREADRPKIYIPKPRTEHTDVLAA